MARGGFQDHDPHQSNHQNGESKLMMKTIMKWSDQAYGIKYVPLRYFNVAGTKPDGSILRFSRIYASVFFNCLKHFNYEIKYSKVIVI